MRKVLETILGFEIEQLEYVNNEEFLKSDVGSHAIRLDVVAKSTGAVYDVEMQKLNIGNIQKRARYYQSQIDVSELDSGTQYSDLKDSYVIFICTFDLFGNGAYVYRFENYDKEHDIEFGDGAKKIIINTKGTKGDISDELRELITYIDRPHEAEKLTTELISKLESKVVERNKDEDWRKVQMKAEADRVDLMNHYMQEGIAVGMEDGIAVGMERGRFEGRNEGYGIARQVFKLFFKGKNASEIAVELGMDESEVSMILG